MKIFLLDVREKSNTVVMSHKRSHTVEIDINTVDGRPTKLDLAYSDDSAMDDMGVCMYLCLRACLCAIIECLALFFLLMCA